MGSRGLECTSSTYLRARPVSYGLAMG
jgi:hypothetical protein